MHIEIVTAPTIEPISLAEFKLHLRLDSGSFSDNVDETQSIIPGSKAVADNYTTHVGTGVDVLGHTAVVFLNSGANGVGGTVDCKIQESDDDITYTDWAGGAFTQVTEANDNAIQEKAYTGTKQYIRTVAKVLVAACVFGTTVIRRTATAIEDDLLTDDIEGARIIVEGITRRALLTQTWDYYLDDWPGDDFITLPFGNLQTAGLSVKWKDTDGAETTLTLTTDYLIETNGEICGRIVLPYAETWPSGSLYPSNPITIRFACGWTAAADIPSSIRTAVKMIGSDLYENRDAQSQGQDYKQNLTIMRLLSNFRLWNEFK